MAFISVFVFVLLCSYVLARFAGGLGLMALPGEHRKHQHATPMVGGIAIFFGMLLGVWVFSPSYNVLIPGLALLCIVGVLDDRFKLASTLRFIAQAGAAYLMIRFSGMELTNLGAIFSSNELHLGNWSVALTVFATIGVINAINMSDGLDGLAGSLVVLVLLTIYLLGVSQSEFLLIVLAAVCGFLFWNLRIGRDRAAIFMGDAGSTVLGLVIAYLLITGSQQGGASFYPVTALWILALPLIDTVAVLMVRPLRGQSPFSADRYHYHHLLQARGLGVNQTVVLILLLQALLIGVGVMMLKSGVAQSLQMALFLVCFAAYFLYVLRATRDGHSEPEAQ